MHWNDVKVFRLEELFKNKFHEQLHENPELWLDYCDKHKIIQMSPSEVEEFFNHKSKTHVCLDNPESDNQFLWIIVPKKFAEKALMLGGLP